MSAEQLPVVLTKNRGVLALVGDHIDSLVKRTLQSGTFEPFASTTRAYDTSVSYHITLLSKAELRSAPDHKLEEVLKNVDPSTYRFHTLGVGGNRGKGVIYLVVIWVPGQQIRRKLGLPPKDFHITLSDKDDHDMGKGIDTLFPGQFPPSPPLELLDDIVSPLHIFGQHVEAQRHSIDMVLHSPRNPKGFVKLAVSSHELGEYKLEMLALACAYDRAQDERVQGWSIKRLLSCSEHTQWGTVFQEGEIPQIPGEIADLLVAPWSPTLRQAIIEAAPTPTLCLASREAMFVPRDAPGPGLEVDKMYKLPRWFRWLVPFRLAIMSTPRNEEDIRVLASSPLGIHRILTLTEETPLNPAWFRGKSISNTFLPVPNYHPPSVEQMDLVMRLFLDDANLPLLVHCGGGKGRAGTVAACYMAACGFKSPSYEQTQPELSAPEAITLLRSIRPKSIETPQQEAMISKWVSTIWKRQSIFPDLPPEPPACPMVVEGALGKDGGDLFMFVGLPGSGKSWVSQSILARDPSTWVHISQDESGSRSLCESAIGRVAKGKKVLFDRCNVSAEDRKLWLSLAATWSTSPVCVWFDYDRDLCESRAQLRAGHPTLPPGGRVRAAIDQMAKKFDRPTLKEGFKATVIIRSFQAAQELVSWMSPPLTIYKFPRTPHLLDLGAATDDDIRSDVAALGALQGRVFVTEKIDGANMGLSLSNDRTQIVVQNRSHYVNSSSHEQFKKLGLWIERHRDELIKMLDKDPYFPERYILFGEWLYATHSIPYTHLPDHFIAYDFFDRSTKTFMDTRTLRNMLAETSIRTVPLTEERDTMPSEAELKAMVQRRSTFYDGRVEGVYVKVERNGSVVYRGKAVRSDFIAGNEHWTRGGVRPNGLALDAS